MLDKSQRHRRRSIRMKGYDYAQPGAYFVTMVTWQRKPLFGEIVEGKMGLNCAGRIVQQEWLRLETQFSHFHLDAFVIMPNHVHCIIIIDTGDVGATRQNLARASASKYLIPGADSDGKGGSPVPEDGFGEGVGATRSSQTSALSSESPVPGENISGRGGSPLQQGGFMARPKGPARGSLGMFIGQFKSRVTKRLWAEPDLDGVPIWQRNYYEHIIRNEMEWQDTHLYIQTNPESWWADPLNTGPGGQPDGGEYSA